MIESEQKRTKQCYFQLNYIETLFICCKRVYSCCFSLGGNLDFLDFLQKSFITSTTGAFAIPDTSSRATAATASTLTNAGAARAKAASAPTPTARSNVTVQLVSASALTAGLVPTRLKGCATQPTGMVSALILRSKWFQGKLHF